MKTFYRKKMRRINICTTQRETHERHYKTKNTDIEQKKSENRRTRKAQKERKIKPTRVLQIFKGQVEMALKNMKL